MNASHINNTKTNKTSKNIKFLLKRTHFLILSILKNKSIIGLLILFPFLSIISPIIFFPFWVCGGFVVELNVILTTGLIYGVIIFGYKKSNLSQNEKLVNKSKTINYLSQYLVIMLFIFISSCIQIILLVIANNFGLLLPTWLGKYGSGGNEYTYDFGNLKYVGWFWSIFWITNITFGIFFSLRNFIKSEKNHYILLMVIIIISFVWGGTLNDYWSGIGYVESIGAYERFIVPTLFPRNLYWPTLIIFPYYAPGQFASQVADFTILTNGSQSGQYVNYNNSVLHFSFANDFPFKNEWNALILMPLIWTMFLFVIGLIFTNKK